MAVKESITLEGAEQVKKAWNDVGQAGENALSQLRTAGLNFGNVVVKFGSDHDKATGAVEKHTGALGGLRNVLHALNPIVRQAGGSVGELGAFSRLAQTGIIGLAAAITGTLLVALSKLTDSSDLSKKRLEELLQSKDLGGKAFETLDQGAKKLGTSTGNLIPIFEAARTAIQSVNTSAKFIGDFPQAAGSVKNLSQSVIDLFTVVRNSTDDSQKAGQALTTFFDAVKRDGVVTKEALDQLRKASPGAVNIIAQAFSLGKVDTDEWLKSISQAPIKLNDLFARLSLFKSLNPQAFEARPVTAFTASLEKLGRRVDDIVRIFTGGDINQLAARLVNAFTGGLTVITNVLLATKDGVVGFFSQIKDSAATVWNEVIAVFSINPFTAVADAFRAMFDDFANKAQEIWNRIKQIFSEPIRVVVNFFNGGGDAGVSGLESTGGAFEAPGGSTGGLFRGKPGIDTNLAWLTNLEYVMRPEAVRRYGVNFMHMVNSLKLPGFSMGGLVDGFSRQSVPAFAAGGLNITTSGAGMRDLSKLPAITFGNMTVRGLLAPHDVADSLVSYGGQRNRASAGRAPSRVGSR